jgi:hypothetical protein
MLKILALAIVIAAVAATSAPVHARLAGNGINLSNGIRISNGIRMPNGTEISTTALQAVRLVMPDGTKVNFR